MRGLVRGSVLVVLALLGMSCGEAADMTPTAIVRDSAGVTIVENTRPTESQRVGWSISTEPSVSIGVIDGDERYQLFQVRDGTVLADGRLVVANTGSSELRVYDPAGAWLASWGGEGEGPGEFTGLNTVAGWAGDSVLAWDIRQRRATIFDGTGALGRTVSLQADDRVARSDFVEAIHGERIMARGTFVFTPDGLESGLDRMLRPYLITSGTGEIEAHLGDHLGPETFAMVSPTMVMITGHPFARVTHEAVWGDLFVVSPSDRYELKAFDETGALVRVVRVEHELQRQTEEELAAFIESRIADADEERRPQMRQQFEGMPIVESLPAFDGLLVDALYYLWVRDYLPPPDNSDRWTVFDADGRALGWIETPTDLRVLEIGADYILGVAEDDFDVEQVQLWGLERSAGDSTD